MEIGTSLPGAVHGRADRSASSRCSSLSHGYQIFARMGTDRSRLRFECARPSFRTRLVEHQAEHRLFELLVAKLSEQGYLKKRGSLRTDSTHMSLRSASIPSGRTAAGNAARRPECRWLPRLPNGCNSGCRLPGSNETPVV